MLEQKKFDSINCKNRFQNPNKSQNMDVCYRYKHFFLFCCVPELPFVMLTPISVLNKTTDIQIKLHGIRLYLIIVFKHKFGLALSHALNTCAVLWCLFFSHCCLIGKYADPLYLQNIEGNEFKSIWRKLYQVLKMLYCVSSLKFNE